MAKPLKQDVELLRQSRPGFEQKRYSPHSIAAIVAELGRQGIDAATALEGTGLSREQIDAHTTKISYRQLDKVIRNALRLSKDPAIGLRAGQRMHVTAYGLYGYALLSSATRKAAEEFADRYVRVVGPFCDFAFSRNEATILTTFEPLHWTNPREDAHRFAVEFALSAHLTTIRDYVGADFRFAGAWVDYAAPAHAETYERTLDCPVGFGQNVSGYTYESVDAPLPLADPRTFRMALEMCEDLLGDINNAGGMSADIRSVLIGQPGQYPTIESIAGRFRVHPRALRRKLEAEGATYRGIVAEVRKRLAIEYLRKTSMTIEEIASRLSYSDAANFRHAFVRWTGKSPSDFRSGEQE
jgi:AraC-like DNA-binding protein